MKDLLNKKIEYFNEIEYPFMQVLKNEVFGDKYQRFYSLTGDGIYNLIHVEDKIYELKWSETKNLLPADGKKAFRDTIKDDIIYLICEELGNYNIEYTVNSGKIITFKISNFIIKIEVIKKAKMPS